MQLKTILNSTYKFNSFIYGNIKFSEKNGVKRIDVEIKERKNGKPICSSCKTVQPGYDRCPTRSFEHIPFWGILLFFIYAPRRVDCRKCNRVVVEDMPWCDGKRTLTNAYSWYLAGWAKKLSWKETAEMFRTSWIKVFSSVEMAVEWGKAHEDLKNIVSIGIDEIKWKCGHVYLTLVYQLDSGRKRLLWVGKDRTITTTLKFFKWFGKERSAKLEFVCSDMWKPYLKVIKRKAGNAINILDRFHICQYMSKAIDKVRNEEVRKLKDENREAVLHKTKWMLLKNPENLSKDQGTVLKELLSYNLRTVRSYLLKEEFRWFWNYKSPYWAGVFLDRWCTKTMLSKIEPMKDVAKMLRRHKPLLLNWFKAKGQFSSGIVEGFNTKAKLTTRKAYGFRTYKCVEIALYHSLGNLPTPKVTHEFF